MKKEIKYRDYRIGKEVYTVKLVFQPNGSIFNGPAVDVHVMAWHLPPRNLWERLIEWWRYGISDSTWEPQISAASLDAYIIDKCAYENNKHLCQDRSLREWVDI